MAWKAATAVTMAIVAMVTGDPAAIGQTPGTLPVCPAPILAPWTARTLGSPGYDPARGVAVDSTRCGIYVAGDTNGTIGAASAGSSDAVLARYSTLGTRNWIVQFGSADYDYVDGVAVDANGDAYVLGHTGGTLLGSPVINLGGTDLFLVKLDGNGVVLWTRMLGSAGDEWPEGMALTSTGDIYVTGFTDGVLTGVSAGGQDYFLGRYDPAGNLVMLVQGGSAGNDRAKAVAVGPADNPYIVGDTDGDLEGVQAGNADIFVAKFDDAGNRLWLDQRGTADLDLGAGIAVNGDQQVFVAGSTALGMDGNVSAGAMDVVLLRYSTAGAWQFTRQRGSVSSDVAAGIALTANGGPVVVGTTSATLDGIAPNGTSDAFVMRFGKAGAWVWTRLSGATYPDSGRGVALSARDDIYLAGDFVGTIAGVPAVMGTLDIFAASWDVTGTPR
jgi:hypothetical protein